jgi:hypothetical protein
MKAFSISLPSPPISQMIGGLAKAVATAQDKLDAHAIAMAEEMSRAPSFGGAGLMLTDGRAFSLLELGFAPSFFKFTEARITIKLSVSSSFEEEKGNSKSKTRRRLGLFYGGPRASTVNADYASKYQYSTDSASMVSIKMVALPTPKIMEMRIQQQMSDARGRKVTGDETP